MLSIDSGEPFPFSPPSRPLGEILRTRFIKYVIVWLLGKDESTVLAQAANSCWETALTIITAVAASDIFKDAGEEPELRRQIEYKSIVVSKWLLSKARSETSKHDFVSWESVTWDTAVVIQCLLTVLNRYERQLSDEDKQKIRDTTSRATKWLYYRFRQWDKEVKYPFGPADVARIAGTLILFADQHPDLYRRIQQEYKEQIDPSDDGEWLLNITKYLLHVKTEQTLTIKISGSAEETVAYWWDGSGSV